MDDRILEKMVIRSGRQVKSPAALALAALALFGASFLWVVMRKLLFAVTGSFHMPLLIVIVMMSLIPLSVVVPLLASRYLAVRLHGEEHSLLDLIQLQMRATAMLFIYTCALCGTQISLAVMAAVWCGIESIPALGVVVYFFFSWIPAFITVVMGILAAFHVLTIISLGAHLSQERVEGNSVLRRSIIQIWSVRWITRLKVLFIGLIPIVLFSVFSSPWILKTLPLSVEVGATIVRTLVLSVFASPFFLFAIHMAVEADRYVGRNE